MIGGSGTRLWPLSRENFPKQFIDLDSSGFTLFQRCIIRAKSIAQDVLLIANFAHRFVILEQLRQINLDGEFQKNINIIFEPMGKNTLSVAIVASLFAQKHGFSRLLLLPSDQIMSNDAIFLGAVTSAGDFFSKNKEGVLTFGITPTFAYDGYGYIEKTPENLGNSVFRVAKFTEKPNQEIAQQYLADKNHLWNCGIFFFCPEFFLKSAGEFEQESLEIITKSFEKHLVKHDFFVLNEEIFKQVKSNSIDFAIMQKLSEVFCIEIVNSGWNDLGSFGQIYDISQKDENANIIDKLVHLDRTSNSHIINKTNHPVIVHGVENLLVIAMKDVITITKKDDNGNKKMFEKLQNSGLSCLKNHCFDHRPWGKYENILEEDTFKIKIITVSPGCELSYQMHNKRSEHWVIISGAGTVTIDDVVKILRKDESIYIPVGVRHKIANNNPMQDLVFVEIQCGSYFGEDDIVRLDDKYGRD